MQERTNDEIRDEVRAHYAGVAKAESKTGCGPSCCAPSRGASGALGYSDAEMAAVPEGADLGLGCGTRRRSRRSARASACSTSAVVAASTACSRRPPSASAGG